MVRDDDVDAQATRLFDDEIRADAGIDADDQGDSSGGGFLDHFAAHSVAIAQAVWDVEGRFAAQQFDSFFQDDDGAGAIDVVVAVKQDRFVLGDSAMQAFNGQIHVFESMGGMQIGQSGGEKAASLG